MRKDKETEQNWFSWIKRSLIKSTEKSLPGFSAPINDNLINITKTREI